MTSRAIVDSATLVSLSACPWCGAEGPRPGAIACARCGRPCRADRERIEWNGSPAPRRHVWRLLARQFHPLSSRVSPLRLLSDWRVEQYYRRVLHDRAFAARWRDHYLGGLNLPPGSAVLDHGCGRGRHVALLRQLGFAVAGQDVAGDAWWGTTGGGAFQVVPPDAPRLPWQNGVFSLVLDVGVIHYMEEARLAGFAAEVFRVLRPRGYWVLVEPNATGYGASLSRRMVGRLHATGDVQQAVKDAGFEHVDLRFEGIDSPVMPRLAYLIRKQMHPAPFDLADFDSTVALKFAPERRGWWCLRVQRPS